MPLAPVALLALRLLETARGAKRAGLIVIAADERRAEALARVTGQLDPEVESLFLPAWDCLPYDRSSPSREIMGRRMAVLRRLAAKRDRPLLLALSVDALLQRIPPASTLPPVVRLRPGEPLDVEALRAQLLREGYLFDDRVDEAGEVAFRGQVIDIFPAAADQPYRFDLIDERIETVRAYDPVTQRTLHEVSEVQVDPASEAVLADGVERTAGIEHALANLYGGLTTVFDLLPKARLLQEPGRAREPRIRRIAAAYEDRRRLETAEAEVPTSPPDAMYLTTAEWDEAVETRGAPWPLADKDWSAVPVLAGERSPGRAFSRYVGEQRAAGRTVVLAAADPRDSAGMVRRITRDHGEVRRIARWAEADGGLCALPLDTEGGFVAEGVALVTASEVLGSRAHVGVATSATPWQAQEADFAEGDVVIYMGHGVGVLRGIERVESAAVSARETVALEYAKAARLLVPVEELHQVWRYGAEAGAVTLDRLDGDGWEARRQTVEGEIAETARALIAAAKARDDTSAAKLVPPRPAYEAFVADFPYATTADQARAVEAVLTDLALGRSMDRLVIGDVGFGKTEVALRAAAAAALAGKQVAVVAPTTVLVSQHVQTFQRRFAEAGIEVAHLSRLTSAAEAKRVKAGLADGSVRIVIGTHALAGESVAFQDLGLLIVDEEQRFGTAHKQRLRDLGQGVHVLTLTATPIPRTLQSALVGLQDLSVIATPPARRRPIRTFSAPFDDATVRQALLHERARRGQSFVVVPRIEDMAPLAQRLAALVPQLTVLQAHGKLPAAAVDETMVRFADGDGDVLLATNIIESGLDVPRANTMLIARADLFGLAQLHQLRGRVGRGRVQGVCYLFTEADQQVSDSALRRLGTLAAFDRLGAGLAISARDLDLRGAGDLVGEDQAGHMKLIGLGLYQHLLGLAIRQARGEDVQDWTPELKLDAPGSLPDDYVPEPALRINLYARLARAVEPGDVDALADELEDRFGEPPPTVHDLLAHARIRSLCRALGVERIDAGPQAIALTLRPDADRSAFDDAGDLTAKGDRLIHARATETPEERLQVVADLLERLR